MNSPPTRNNSYNKSTKADQDSTVNEEGEVGWVGKGERGNNGVNYFESNCWAATFGGFLQ